MAIVVATSVAQCTNEPGFGDEETFEASLGTSTDGDTVTVALPARWQAKGFNVRNVSCYKWTTGSPATAEGARTKTAQPISVVSYVESTGVISLLLGTGADVGGTESARVLLTVCPSRS